MSGFVINPEITTIFNKGIRIGNVDNDSSETAFGTIRYNTERNRFEGLHKLAGAGAGGSDNNNMSMVWREFTTDIASSSKLGGVKVGNNLLINPSTGILSSIATGESRIYQQIITVSDNAGAADYDNITEAITQALGTAPDYEDGSITSNYGPPSQSNQYIIQVSPGEYTEKIVLPPYVSLRGEGRNITYIKSPVGSTSLGDALITLNEFATIENLTLEITAESNYAAAIYAIDHNNITIRNIDVANAVGFSTYDVYGIYLSGGSSHNIENVFIKYNTIANSTITGIYINGTNATMRDIKININGSTSASSTTGINIRNSPLTSTIQNADIYLTAIELCRCINIHDTNLILNNGRFIANGDDQFVNNAIAYGIQATSDEEDIILTTDTVEFIHYDVANTNDNFYSPSVDFLDIGFTENKFISITDASNNANNGIFQIARVAENNVSIMPHQRFANEESGQTITLKQLYRVEIYNTYINTSSDGNTKYAIAGNGNFSFETKDLITTGGLKDPNSKYPRETKITVASNGTGDYYLLTDALLQCLDATEHRRYVIEILNGKYHEPSPITINSYVSINGESKENTKLYFHNIQMNEADAAISLTSNTTLRNITINNIIVDENVENYTTGLFTNEAQNINIINCDIYINGANTLCGIYFTNTTFAIENVNITVEGGPTSTYCYGLRTDGSNFAATDCTIHVNKPSIFASYGLWAQNTNATLYNPRITVLDEQTTDIAILLKNNNTMTAYKTEIFNAVIIADKVVLIEDENILFIANASNLNGEIDYDETDNLAICNNCYSNNNSNSIEDIPLNRRGVDDTENGNEIMGYKAGKQGQSGTHNTIYGHLAAKSLTTASKNTIIGYKAGQSLTSGGENIFIGDEAGQNTQTGTKNVYIGSNAGTNAIETYNTVLIGQNAAPNMENGANTVAIGANVLYNATEAVGVIAIGKAAGYNTTDGSYNTFIGGGDNSNIGVGYTNTTGTRLTYIGYQAGKSSNTATDSIAVGYRSGYNAEGSKNTIIGTEAAYDQTGGTNSVFVGYRAGYGNNATGDVNTIIGTDAGHSLTSASAIVAIGAKTAYSLTTGTRNVFIGGESETDGNDSAGYAATTAADSIAIGTGAAMNLTTATNIIAIGSSAGTQITTGSDNIAIGQNAGSTYQTTTQNICIGKNAAANYQGANILALGHHSGEYTLTDASVFIGNYAGQYIQGRNNTYAGYEAGRGINGDGAGTHNVGIGAYVMRKIDGGSRNIVIGSGEGGNGESAGSQLDDGNDNIILGYKTAKSLIDGNNNIIAGTEAGKSMNSTDGSIVIGYKAAYSEVSGDYGIILGYEAGYNQNGVDASIFIGYQAGYNNTTGENNINIGKNAGYTSQTTSKTINIGTDAGYNATTADGCINIGYNAGRAITTGENGIYIGYESGASGEISGVNNLCIGTQTGKSLTSGARNIIIGSQAGNTLTMGTKSILIGNYAGHNMEASKNIFIGITDNDTFGVGHNSAGDNNICIGSNAAVSLTTADLDIIIGRQAGEKLTEGTENISIGYRAGQEATTANYNISIGSNAHRYNQTGDGCITIGRNAGSSDEHGTDNINTIAIGTEAGTRLASSSIIAVGRRAGRMHTTGSNCIYLGASAGRDNETGSDSIFIGSSTGRGGTNIDRSVLVGHFAGRNLDSGTDNIFIGYQAGYDMTTGMNNVIIGTNAFESGNASNVVAIGFECGILSTQDDNIMIGSQAGKALTDAAQSIFIGRQAGTSTTTGSGNIYFGAQSGELNTTGAYNIGVGYQTLRNYATIEGYNIAFGYRAGSNIGAVDYGTPYRNIIMGFDALRNGNIADDSIIIGTNAATNADNHILFKKNIVLGANAGTNANLATKSIIVGSQAMETGTGGENNIIFGNEAGKVVGNPLHKIFTVNMVGNAPIITINLTYGVASYYFHPDDTVIIDISGGNNQMYYEREITAIMPNTIDTTDILLNERFEGDFIDNEIKIYTIAKTDITNGAGDKSKASSNTIFGNRSGIEITTGSKNNAIGDNALITNKVGRYNIAFGSYAGKSVITDNNTCIGTNAGENIDNYTPESLVGTDIVFYESNNHICSTTTDLSGYILGSIIEIEGSSGNDRRFTVLTSNPTTIKVDGYPKIEQDGVPSTVSGEAMVITGTRWHFYNIVFTSLFLQINNNSMELFNDETTTFDDGLNTTPTQTTNTAKIFKINNSKLNTAYYHNRSTIASTSTVIYLNETEELYNENTMFYTLTNDPNNIKPEFEINMFNLLPTNIVANGITMDNIKYNHIFYINYGENRGTYRNTYNNKFNTNNNIKFHENNELINDINTIFTQSIKINNELADTFTSNSFKIHLNQNENSTVLFDPTTGKIKTSFVETFYTDNLIKFNTPYQITGTDENNSYISIISRTADDSLNVSIPAQLQNESVSSNTVIFSLSTFTNLNNIDSTYTAGDIINLYYKDYTQDATEGAYYVKHVNNNSLAINDVIERPQNIRNGTGIAGTSSIILNKDIYNIADITDIAITEYIVSGNDIIYQNKSVVCFATFNENDGGDTSSTYHSTIEAEEFTFTDMIAPLVIKITGSENNNKYFLVKANEFPYNILEFDPSTPITFETAKEITITVNTISSYLKMNFFSMYSPEMEITTLGSKFNAGKRYLIASEYNGTYPITENSMFIDESTPLTTENGDDLALVIGRSNGFRYSNVIDDAAVGIIMDEGYYEYLRNFSIKGYFHRIIFKSVNEGGDYPWTNQIIPDTDIPIKVEIFNQNVAIEPGIYVFTCNVMTGVGITPNLDADNSNSNAFFTKSAYGDYANASGKRSYITINNSDYAENNGSYMVVNKTTGDHPNGCAYMSLELYKSNHFMVQNEDSITNSNILVGTCQFHVVDNPENGNQKDINTSHIAYHLGKNAAYLGFTKYNVALIPDFFIQNKLSANRMAKNTLHYGVSFDKYPTDDIFTDFSNIGVNSFTIPTDTTYYRENGEFAEPYYEYIIELGSKPIAIDEPTRLNFGFISSIAGTDTGFTSTVNITTNGTNKHGTISFYSSNNVIKMDDIHFNFVQPLNTLETNKTFNGKTYYETEKPFYKLREGMVILITSNGDNISVNNGPHKIKTIYSNSSAIQLDRDYTTLTDETYQFDDNNNISITPLKGIYSNRFNFTYCQNDTAGSDLIEIFDILPAGPFFGFSGNITLQVMNKSRLPITYQQEYDQTQTAKQIFDYSFIVDLFNLNFMYKSIVDISHIGWDDISNVSIINRIGHLNNSLIFPTEAVTTTYTDLYFVNASTYGLMHFYASNGAIKEDSESGVFADFKSNSYISIDTSIMGEQQSYFGIYFISQATSTTLILENPALFPLDSSAMGTISTNCILSRNTNTANLAVFKAGQTLIVSGTQYNNISFVANSSVNTRPSAIYLDSPVIPEIPNYMRIIRPLVVNESNALISTGPMINFDNGESSITVANGYENQEMLNIFRKNQEIVVSNTEGNDGVYTLDIRDPTNTVMYLSTPPPNNEINSYAKIEKRIQIRKIGEPTISTIPNAINALFNNEDPTGNNLMIGSFAGHQVGKLSYAAHNVYIGNKTGQCNHGSGNILIGGENGLAINETQGATFYNNKFAIYKTNFIGVKNNPLIGGDFATNIVGINTITPEIFADADEISETAVKLVVNGTAYANAYSPFSGVHKVKITSTADLQILKAGMILITTGKTIKHNILNTTMEVELSKKEKQKNVIGVFTHTDMTTNQEKIYYCLSLGEGCMYVCDINGELENGDLVMSSNVVGIGCKQIEEYQANFTIGKITENIDWTNYKYKIMFNGKNVKIVLASVVIYCG